MRWGLTLLAVAVVGVLVVVPVVHVFHQALSRGFETYWANLFGNADTRHALALTLAIAVIAVVVNLFFGIAAAWCIARFRFPGRTLLVTLIDLPFSVSPIVVGLALVLVFGMQGFLGPWLKQMGVQVLFAPAAIILATAFVTFPFVARELIPVMEAIGPDEELAAVSLGARGWQIFWKVTLPNVQWGVLYGVILCNARAMGEFGAVYVVSGRVPGQTDTLPLRVERLFQDYNSPGAFAVASILTLLAVLTLIAKAALERKAVRETESVGEEGAQA